MIWPNIFGKCFSNPQPKFPAMMAVMDLIPKLTLDDPNRFQTILALITCVCVTFLHGQPRQNYWKR